MMNRALLLLVTFLSIACTYWPTIVSAETTDSGWLYSAEDEDQGAYVDNVYKLQQKIILSKSEVKEESRDSLENHLKNIDVESFDWRNDLDALKELNGGSLTVDSLRAIKNKMENVQLSLDNISKNQDKERTLATEEDRKRILAKILSEPVSKAMRSHGLNNNYGDEDVEQDPDYEESDDSEDESDDDDDDNWDDEDDDELFDGGNQAVADGKSASDRFHIERADSMEYVFDEQDKKNKGKNDDKQQQQNGETNDSIEHDIDEKNLEPRKKKFFNLEEEEAEYNLDNIKLIVYGKNKEPVKFLAEPSIDEIVNCDIDFTGKVAAVSHGFWNSAESENMVLLRREVLKLFDVAIFIDWSPYGQFWMYKTSARSTKVFGEILGQFLVDLHQQKGLRYDQLHMMGYSLGAHIVAFASRQIASKENGSKPRRLTAFDPALPLIADTKGVRMTDAEIVQVIHTNAGFFGQTEKRGHIDFYPNGGNSQPQCASESALTMKSQSCDHARAIMLFISTLEDCTDEKEHECQLVGYPCNSYSDYLLGQCSECNRSPEEQCRRILHESEPVEDVERLKSLYLVGGVPGALCAAASNPFQLVPNYHVELDYWPDADSTQRSSGPDQLPLVIRFKTRSGHILKASFDMSIDRAMALLVDHGRPTKIKNARIAQKSYHNLIRSMKLTYLSHTDAKVTEKYSVTLCFYKNSTVRGELFVMSKKKSCWHNDKLERQHSSSGKTSLVSTPFYKQAKYGLPTTNGITTRS